jgi:hypothetical protein
MATTTTNFGWDIPQSTDLVKDGATAIAALGQDIDTALVDLKGGTTGQVLAKATNTDLDFSWVAQDDSNAIQNAIVDAKGDLIAATAADTPARLAIGTNNQVLTVDSTAATGMKWATPTAATPTFSGVLLDNSPGSYNISNNTATALTFDTETYDTDGYHSTSSNTSRITIPAGKGGYFQVGGHFEMNANTSGFRILSIYKNGSVYKTVLTTPSGLEPSMMITCPILLAAGDYVELFYTQTSGSTQAIYINGGYGAFYANYLGA